MADDQNTEFKMNQFTETSTQSWMSRIGGSVIGLLIGILLIPGAIALLAWNEGRAVAAANSLKRGAGSIVEISGKVAEIANNNKLVYVTGPLAGTNDAIDPMTGVSAKGLLRLQRNVEMFQWVETTHTTTMNNVGGSQTTEKTYSYSKKWSSSPVRSEQFKVPAGHENPQMDISSKIFNAGDIKIGVLTLDQSLVDKLNNFTLMSALPLPPQGFLASGNTYFKGRDPQQPQVGDIKISYSLIDEQNYSIAAKQSASKLVPFQDAKSGYTIDLIEPGTIPVAKLFADQQSTEIAVTWGLRGLGFIMLFLGFNLLFGPIQMVAAVLPFLGSLAGIASGFIAFCLAIPVMLITISIAWIATRPLLGTSILVAGLIIAFGAQRLINRKQVVA